MHGHLVFKVLREGRRLGEAGRRRGRWCLRGSGIGGGRQRSKEGDRQPEQQQAEHGKAVRHQLLHEEGEGFRRAYLIDLNGGIEVLGQGEDPGYLIIGGRSIGGGDRLSGEGRIGLRGVGGLLLEADKGEGEGRGGGDRGDAPLPWEVGEATGGAGTVGEDALADAFGHIGATESGIRLEEGVHGGFLRIGVVQPLLNFGGKGRLGAEGLVAKAILEGGG